MYSGINSKKLFYVISSFLLLFLIILTLKVNYASSAGNPENDGKITRTAAAATTAEIENKKNGPDEKPALEEPAVQDPSKKSEKAQAASDPIGEAISKKTSNGLPAKEIKELPGKYTIVVDKSKFELRLSKGDKLVKTYKVAIGRNPDGADKQAKGDLRTPEGHFYVMSVEKSDKWLHNGTYAYGPWFLRLKTPWSGIGIHGTDVPESLGSRASEGCIRLHSDDITELKGIVEGQVKKGKDKVTVDVVANLDALDKTGKENAE